MGISNDVYLPTTTIGQIPGLQRRPVGCDHDVALGTTIVWTIFCSPIPTRYEVRNASVLIGLKFALGMLESCVAPILILIISMFYTKSEQVGSRGFNIDVEFTMPRESESHGFT